ncbi:MAG: hypothetical protein IPF57_24415 [Gammaproteobacteria bacterium]|nr:hypothetical protein [Gammaproteobacteria bacterium]
MLGHYYSAPYQLVRQEVDVRISAPGGTPPARKRVASHRRSPLGAHTTLAHMPQAHRHYASGRRSACAWAESGPATAEVVATILGSRAHPQQGFRSCLGIMRLGQLRRRRLEAAAASCDDLHEPALDAREGLDRPPIPPIARQHPAQYYH